MHLLLRIRGAATVLESLGTICLNNFAPTEIMLNKEKIGNAVKFLGALCTGLPCIFLAACNSKPMPKNFYAISEFAIKHPSPYKEYVYLNPVSFDSYRSLLGLQLAEEYSLLKDFQKKYGSSPGVDEYVEAKMRQESSEMGNTLRHYKELESLSLPGGAVCQFARTNRATKEMGLLVIRNGDIVDSDVWVVDYLNKNEIRKP